MSEALTRAGALHEIGRYEQAAASVSAHLAGHPDDARAWVLLARCALALDDRPTALHAVDEALRADPRQLSGWIVRAELLAGARRYAEAEAAARESIRLAPHFWGAYQALAWVLDRSGDRSRRPEAYAVARRAAELAPEHDSAHFLVGVTAHRLRDFRTAELAYRTALRLNPQSGEAHNNLAMLRMRGRWWRRGAWTAAAEGFATAAALDGEDRDARFNLESMAWGVAAGARWVALAGFVVAVLGTVRVPGDDSAAAARATAALMLVALWAGWAVWVRRRVPARLRRPMLLLARRCRPVVAMGAAVGLLGLHSLIVVAVPGAGSSAIGGLGVSLFWVMLLTYWFSRAALNRRRPADG
ncbi:tetratricopeptide repeat protein [Streptomyces odonnellii]|uniref:tetratricopeptide repeat protein n=1 Tax=Streptomyces odonnellii TaxID=1417980 RepID=UPI000624FFA5|nr:tetratricopeptide repeat protein [Streptomyces odonnellii]